MKFKIPVFDHEFTFSKKILIGIIKVYEIILDSKTLKKYEYELCESEWNYYWNIRMILYDFFILHGIEFSPGCSSKPGCKNRHYVSVRWENVHDNLENHKIMIQEKIWNTF